MPNRETVKAEKALLEALKKLDDLEKFAAERGLLGHPALKKLDDPEKFAIENGLLTPELVDAFRPKTRH